MSSRRFLIPVFVILTFLAQMAMPAVARADDGVPPEPVATEVPVEPGTGEEPRQSVPEILAQVPQGTDIAVVNPDGEPEPLATLAAEETIASSDPVWCPSTVTDPSDGSCTPGQASITDLINYLEDNAATYYGDGTIFFQADVYTDTELSIILLSDAYDYDLDSGNDLGALGALKIYGGWDLDSVSPTYGEQLAGGTTFNLPILIDWQSDLTVQDVVVDVDYGDYSLQISSGGDVALTNVDVVDNALGSGASLDTCVLVDINPDPDITEWACSETGTVTITGSDFDGNAGDGLWVESIGSISLNTVSASDNGLWGAGLDNTDGTGSILIGTDVPPKNWSRKSVRIGPNWRHREWQNRKATQQNRSS